MSKILKKYDKFLDKLTLKIQKNWDKNINYTHNTIYDPFNVCDLAFQFFRILNFGVYRTSYIQKVLKDNLKAVQLNYDTHLKTSKDLNDIEIVASKDLANQEEKKMLDYINIYKSQLNIIKDYTSEFVLFFNMSFESNIIGEFNNIKDLSKLILNYQIELYFLNEYTDKGLYD